MGAAGRVAGCTCEETLTIKVRSPHLNSSTLVREHAGTGQPVVLLHGLGETSIAWRPVHHALSRAYDVIAVDLPGFGSSSPLPSGTLPTATRWRMPWNARWTPSASPTSKVKAKAAAVDPRTPGERQTGQAAAAQRREA